jgi:hypothetical protein
MGWPFGVSIARTPDDPALATVLPTHSSPFTRIYGCVPMAPFPLVLGSAPGYAYTSQRTSLTTLAQSGVPLDQIQAIGRWASSTFRIYIRQHPVLLTAQLTSRDNP